MKRKQSKPKSTQSAPKWERLFSPYFQRVIIVAGRGIIPGKPRRRYVADTSGQVYPAASFVPFHAGQA